LPSFARCDRPTSACVSTSGVQPGGFVHGPEENCGLRGRTSGLSKIVVIGNAAPFNFSMA
jgi:hypothetical protein